MSEQEGRPHSSAADVAVPAAQASAIAVLDQSLWTQFSKADSADEFVQAWLGLQCRYIPGAVVAVVVLGEPDIGPFTPVACWPRESAVTDALRHSADEAIANRQSVVVGGLAQESGTVAVPIEVDDKLFGVVAVTLTKTGLPVADALRQLRWGTGWLESLLRREQSAVDAALYRRTLEALDFISILLDRKSFKQSCSALVTELAERLGCDPVAIGFKRRNRTKVVSVSHVSGFDSRMNLVRDFGLAMDEALDQEDIVLHPMPEGWDYRITRVHEDLASQYKAGAILTVPMPAGDALIGAITLERPEDRPFDSETIELCDVVASMAGPILTEKRKNDRWIIVKLFDAIWRQIRALLGPRYLGRKVATIALIALVYLGVTTYQTFNVVAPARVEGSIQRTVVAPFNGYIQSETVRAGAEVEEGEILATLNDRDLTLERLRWSTARTQRQLEYDRALAEAERSQVNIIRSQIEQAEAQISLLDEQLARTIITAPFDGVVVSGDLSQSVGSAIERGQELFRIAPLDSYRVVLEVDEADIAEVALGQIGQLRLSTSPDLPFPIAVERITPVAAQRDGRNFFRVEAALTQSAGWIRPNMAGVARVAVDERSVVDIWTRRLVNWARLALWRLSP